MQGKKPKHYDLDKIPVHRQNYIEKRLKEFKKEYGLKSAPIDGVQLLRRICMEGKRRICVQVTSDLPSVKLAKTLYIRKVGLYLISINRSQIVNLVTGLPKYPFRTSSDRMLNFTICHEIGHIELDHFELEDKFKDEEAIALEELEANEFAGRLLMPETALKECSFKSVPEVAKEFMVSEHALLKRLSNLNRHDLRQSKPFPVCHNCHNPNIKDNYLYCPVCGSSLMENEGGVITMKYTDGYSIDDKGRAYPCPRCGNSVYGDGDIYCRICGFHLYNECTNDFCGTTTIADGSARYCYVCGSPTTFLTDGILNDWQPSREMLLSIRQMEDDLCGFGDEITPIENWYLVLFHLAADGHGFIADLLEGSTAKMCGGTLVVYMHDIDAKKRIDRDDYREYIQMALEECLGQSAEEVKIIAYQEYLPVSEPVDTEDLPF